MSIREPISLLSRELVAHAIIMPLAMIVLAVGVAKARRKSPAHRYIQFFGILAATLGVAMVLFSNSEAMDVLNAAAQPHSKRHVPGIVEGRHAHATWHTNVGLALYVALLLQALVGFLASPSFRALEIETRTAAKVHRIIGHTLVFVMAPLQMASGVMSAFQLCSDELSGTDQCVGHNAVAAVLVAVAVVYQALSADGKGMTAEKLRSEYHVITVENGLVAVGGTAIVLYSLYSEFPYTSMNSRHHLSAGLLLGVAGTLAVVRTFSLRNRTAALDAVLVRGIAIVIVVIVVGLLMMMHEQLNDYGRRMHMAFGGALLTVALFRMLLWWRSLAAATCAAASLFVASQRGFQILYAEHYCRFASIAEVVVGATVVGLCVYGSAYFYASYAQFIGSGGDDVDDDDSDARGRRDVEINDLIASVHAVAQSAVAARQRDDDDDAG